MFIVFIIAWRQELYYISLYLVNNTYSNAFTHKGLKTNNKFLIMGNIKERATRVIKIPERSL